MAKICLQASSHAAALTALIASTVMPSDREWLERGTELSGHPDNERLLPGTASGLSNDRHEVGSRTAGFAGKRS